jgi:hypothetical protein
MFQQTILELIKRVENLSQKNKSIIELDLTDIKEQIQETLFKIDFTPDTIENLDQEEIKEYNVNHKEALGLFFFAYISTLRFELSYKSLWIDIIDILLDDEEDDYNSFFIDNYFIDENEPSEYLLEAMDEAIVRFGLRRGYDKESLIDTILLQLGLLKRLNNLNYWLCGKSKSPIINELTNRSSDNFSSTFNSGYKLLQKYSQNQISKEEVVSLLKQNVWFKDFNLDELLSASKARLHTTLISKDEIEGSFYLDSVKFVDEELLFNISLDDFDTLGLDGDSYDVLVDKEFRCSLKKDEDGAYFLEEIITIKNPENYTLNIEIKDTQKILYKQEFVLFDFNHDILVFDEDGKYTFDTNKKLDSSKSYSVLIDSDFETQGSDDIYEYFDGYVNLITNLTIDSGFKADDGDEYEFSLNFSEDITIPEWINNLELYAISDFLELDAPIKFNLKQNKFALSSRQSDELIDISEDAKIVRWTYNGGVVYELEDIEEFAYDMDLSEDILINRKNTLKIKVDDRIFTKQLNVTLIEKTQKHIYRTFLKDSDNYIKPLRGSNKLTTNDIKNNQIIITAFHEDFITTPELKTQILRDKATVYGEFELNKFFSLEDYPYYGDEISSARKIYDDIAWNTFCSVEVTGLVKSFDGDLDTALLYEKEDSLTLILLDSSYKLSTKQIDASSKKIKIDSDALGFVLIKDGDYVGSYFKSKDLDIETIFKDVELLKFLRLSYFPFGEYFNSVEYESNRAQRDKARNDKKKQKRLLRDTVKENISIFLDAFISDEFIIDDIKTNLAFNHSQTIVEQILFVIEFNAEEALKIVREIILNRWQDKMIGFPLFLVYLLNVMKDDRYYQIFLDELEEDIIVPTDIDEEFHDRMIKAILSNHKIEGYEKINIKTITQTQSRDYFIKKSIEKLIEINELKEKADT